MIKKTLLVLLILNMTAVNSENQNKILIEAGQPSIQKASQSTDNQLVLSVGAFDPLIEKLDFSKTNILDKESSKYRIIQFEEGKADSQWLKKRGIQVLSYLPNNAFVIATDNETIQILDSNSLIRWHGPYGSGFKISPELWQKNIKSKDDYDLMITVFSNYPKNKIASLFKKYIPKANITQIFSGSNNFVSINIKQQNINQTIQKLSLLEVVQYIEIIKQEKETNTEAVSAIQANEASGNSSDDSSVPAITPIWDKGLIGTGQIVGVADSGLDSNEDWFVHYDNGNSVTHEITEAEETTPPQIGTLFPNRKVIGYFTMPNATAYDESGHGTHVVGSVAGDRLAAIGSGPSGNISSPTDPGYDNDDGMAPNAQILFQDHSTINDEGESFIVGVDRFAMWEQSFNSGARIHSNSYGAPTDGVYTFGDYNADRTLHAFEDMIILIASGNSGPSPSTVGSSGVAKNVLTVGRVGHGNSRTVYTTSSRGPTVDGRLKPDIAAPGSSIESARNDFNNDLVISPPQRASFSGTSMSTPITAGSVALLRQYFTDGFYPTGIANPNDEHNPTGPLMKALLINGAGIDGGHFDNNIGWGRVNLSGSLVFTDDINNRQLRAWEVNNSNGLKTNESKQFKIGVSANHPLIVTLTWYDNPASSSSGLALINDLDLTVEINGTVYHGNNFNNAESQENGTLDKLNTVEQVRISTPVSGIYTITVNGASVPGDGSNNSNKQGFALAVSAELENIGSLPGALTDISSINSNAMGQVGNQLSWNGGDNADYFEVYRADGSCDSGNNKQYRYIGNTESSEYIDDSTIGGYEYSYKIRPAKYGELGELSGCTDLVSQQICDSLPTFNQDSVIITNAINDSCLVELAWESAQSSCPESNNIKYNVYRSNDFDFMPSEENLIATTDVNVNDFEDIYAPSGIATYYIVLAEDETTNSSGPNQGNQTTEIKRVVASPFGSTTTGGTLIENVDDIALMNTEFPWQITSQRASEGLLSYHSAEDNSNYPNNTCGRMTTAQFHIPNNPQGTPMLTYQARYDIEADWDGVVVEISEDNGMTWSDFPPVGGYPGDFNMTQDPPINGCSYPTTQGAFNGTSGNQFIDVSHELSPYSGKTVLVRWSLSTDPGAEEEGFYIDNIQYKNIDVPNACTVNTAPNKPQPGFYYDPAHNGHGFGIEAVPGTDLYYILFYSYNDNNEPEWFSSLSSVEDRVFNVNNDDGTLLRSIYDYSIGPGADEAPFSIDNSIGVNKLKIEFNSEVATAADACNDGTTRSDNVSLVTWQLGDQQDQWCVQPIISTENLPNPDFGGTWWSGLDDNGWGFSVAFTGDVMVVIMYYYDADGNPRWAQGVQSGFQVGQEITLELKELTGYPRDEVLSEVTEVNAGTATMTLNANAGEDSDGSLNVNITYQGSEGGTWSRTGIPIKLFTEAH